MNIEFNKVSEFNRGTIFELLADAYSFDYRCAPVSYTHLTLPTKLEV